MNFLSIENISKSYSEKQLLNNISLGINDGDKIGLIGVNGTGKSTLLKVVAGIDEPDDGKIIKGNSVRIEYLSQNPYFDNNAAVIEQVFKGNSPIMEVIKKYEAAAQNPDTPDEIMLQLTHSMDSHNAWGIESEAKAVLTKLGVFDFNARVETLSGGQRKRIALASALITPCELLILDEPTNHLDNDTIEWLEQYLNKRKGSLLMVTHDRYFLDRVVNKIIELDRGSLYSYEGNYSSFIEKKLDRQQIEAANENKRQNMLRKELAWIKRGAKARSTKQKARIDRFEELSSQEAYTASDKVEISVAGSRLGRKVVELENINKSFGSKKVIEGFDYIVLRDDRVGIVGPNGSGKSTLLNIIYGTLKPDSGQVEKGETVKVGLYSQETSHMDGDMRVIEYIKEAAEVLTTVDGYRISASQMLERFLFSPSMQWTPISKLSGGEKRRLYLLRVLMESPNVLLLDEPTNDLDIETLAILEDYIDDFKGTVIAVSHDRYFLDRVADKIFAFEGDGKITQYTGNYSNYKENYIVPDGKAVDSAGEADRNKDDKKAAVRAKEKALKFTFKEQREYDEIDDCIAHLENDIQEIEKKIEMASSDYNLLQQLLSEKEELENQLDDKMERWVYLNDLAERIEAEKANKRL